MPLKPGDDALFLPAGGSPPVQNVSAPACLNGGVDALIAKLMPVSADSDPHFIHVWQFSLDVSATVRRSLSALLSDAEAARAQRFRFEQLRHRYQVCHGLTRVLLASYLQTTPRAISFTYGDFDKPYVADLPCGTVMHFNLSHSAGLGMLALSRTAEVGVDVELPRDNVSTMSIAERYFSTRETKWMAALPEARRQQAFFTSWVRKEAYIKALGKGLSEPLNAFEIQRHPRAHAWFVVRDTQSSDVKDQWCVRDLTTEPGVLAAVAYSQPGINDLDERQSTSELARLRHFRLAMT